MIFTARRLRHEAFQGMSYGRVRSADQAYQDVLDMTGWRDYLMIQGRAHRRLYVVNHRRERIAHHGTVREASHYSG